MTPAAAARALVLGLASAPSCAALCMPVVTPLLLTAPDTGLRIATITLLLFSAGRLAGYALVGLLTGLLGREIPLFVFPATYLLLGTLAILHGTLQSFPTCGLCRLLNPHTSSSRYALLFGVLTGLNLCPPFLLAIAAAAELGRPLEGTLFFALFFLGTSAWLLLLVPVGGLARFKTAQLTGRILAVIAGLWYAWLGITALI